MLMDMKIGGLAALVLGAGFVATCPARNFSPLAAPAAEKPAADAGDKEVPVEIKDLPAVVTDAIKKAYPEGKIIKADKETENGKTVYGVDVKVGDKVYDVDVDEAGKIVEQKEAEAPAKK